MTLIDRNKPVMVTGATGYVAGWLVKSLLDEGLTVHAAVRNPNDKIKLKYLDEIAASSKGNIIYFKSDLLTEGSYEEAMSGCELVYHTASPFTIDVKDPLTELVEPAKLGTRNVLSSANKITSVKRVVLTSSCAAIYGDNIDVQNAPNGILTEEVWNTSSNIEHGAYSYSKTLGEKEAWSIVKKQSRWDLVVLNPSLVMGPATNPSAVTSESFNMIKQFGDGSLKTGVPPMAWGVVDVRDLAFAHFQAGFVPNAQGRHIISGHNTSYIEMAQVLLPDFGEKYPIPSKVLPKWLLWLIGPLANKLVTRTFVSRNMGYAWKGDNSKSRRELGVNYRALQDTMVDMFQQIVDKKII